MYAANPPVGITPPTPGLEHEEPEFALEEDIPMDDSTRQDIGAQAREGDDADSREIERE